jgi:hypothetical protein
MTAEHFSEILGTVMLSTQSSKRQIADYLYVSTVTLNLWCKNGLPQKRSMRIMKKLRVYLFTNLGGLENVSNG